MPTCGNLPGITPDYGQAAHAAGRGLAARLLPSATRMRGDPRGDELPN